VDNLFVQLLGGILVTAIGYLAVPFVLRTSRGKYEPQKAKKIALWNSIIVGACFCIASADKGVAWSAGPAFLYYWINCSILTDKNAADTDTVTTGDGNTMGLFKKKLPSHEEKLSLAYRAFKQDMVEMIFPGKKQQADCVVRSLAVITSTNLNACTAKDYFDILSVFSGVLIRRVVTHSDDSHIIAMLQQKHGNYVKSKSVAQKVLTYCKLNMNNNSFVLSSKKDFEALDMLVSLFASNENIAKGNSIAQTENLKDPQYGLIPEKPIYAKSVSGSEQYLGKLRTESGDRITWKRRGATFVSGVNGMVDIYNCFDPSGKKCGTIYINMYGTQNSNVAPTGFIMEGEKPKKTATPTPPVSDIKLEAENRIPTEAQTLESKKAEDKAVVTECIIAQKRPTFCRKCGTKLLPDSVFCMKCGTKVQMARE